MFGDDNDDADDADDDGDDEDDHNVEYDDTTLICDVLLLTILLGCC